MKKLRISEDDLNGIINDIKKKHPGFKVFLSPELEKKLEVVKKN